MNISRLFFLLAFLCSSAMAEGVPTLTGEQTGAAIEASNRQRGDRSFWRGDEVGLIFGYDGRWTPTNSSQKSTAAKIDWIAKSGGLMATCYLEINDSEVGALSPNEIRQKARQIVDALLQNGRLRDPNMKLVTWRPATQDNHPVVYVERDMAVTNINKTVRARVYSVTSSWRGREINFECASTVPINMPVLGPVVEGPINDVLGSLQFVRSLH